MVPSPGTIAVCRPAKMPVAQMGFSSTLCPRRQTEGPDCLAAQKWHVGILETEPPRLYRRPFGLSYAAIAGASERKQVPLSAMLTLAQSQGPKMASTIARGKKQRKIKGYISNPLKSCGNPAYPGRPFQVRFSAENSVCLSQKKATPSKQLVQCSLLLVRSSVVLKGCRKIGWGPPTRKPLSKTLFHQTCSNWLTRGLRLVPQSPRLARRARHHFRGLGPRSTTQRSTSA